MTLNKMTKAIMKEHGCCRRHANRLAHKIIDEIQQMDEQELKENDRQAFLTRKKIRKEWSDTLQSVVIFAE